MNLTLAPGVTLTVSDDVANSLRGQLGNVVTTTPGPTPTPTPPPPGVRIIDLHWGAPGSGNVTIDTRNYGGFRNETIAVRFTTPNATSAAFAKISGIESNAAISIFRTACLSEVPGDLTHPISLYGRSVGTGFSFAYGVGAAATQYKTNLKPGTTYYVNIKNQDSHGNPTCPPGVSADMFVELAKPSGL
jgi:hypothetical protein